MIKAVGFIIFLEGSEQIAVLIRRGRHERAGEVYRKESWPGVCQATMHVEMTPEESATGPEGLVAALRRGVKKELGIAIYRELNLRGAFDKLKPLHTLNSDKRIVITFSATLPDKIFYRYIRTPDKTTKVYVRPYELARIKLVNLNEKENEVDEKTITMFPDEFEALKKGFSEY